MKRRSAGTYILSVQTRHNRRGLFCFSYHVYIDAFFMSSCTVEPKIFCLWAKGRSSVGWSIWSNCWSEAAHLLCAAKSGVPGGGHLILIMSTQQVALPSCLVFDWKFSGAESHREILENWYNLTDV